MNKSSKQQISFTRIDGLELISYNLDEPLSVRTKTGEESKKAYRVKAVFVDDKARDEFAKKFQEQCEKYGACSWKHIMSYGMSQIVLSKTPDEIKEDGIDVGILDRVIALEYPKRIYLTLKTQFPIKTVDAEGRVYPTTDPILNDKEGWKGNELKRILKASVLVTFKPSGIPEHPVFMYLSGVMITGERYTDAVQKVIAESGDSSQSDEAFYAALNLPVPPKNIEAKNMSSTAAMSASLFSALGKEVVKDSAPFSQEISQPVEEHKEPSIDDDVLIGKHSAQDIEELDGLDDVNDQDIEHNLSAIEELASVANKKMGS